MLASAATALPSCLCLKSLPLPTARRSATMAASTLLHVANGTTLVPPRSAPTAAFLPMAAAAPSAPPAMALRPQALHARTTPLTAPRQSARTATRPLPLIQCTAIGGGGGFAARGGLADGQAYIGPPAGLAAADYATCDGGSRSGGAAASAAAVSALRLHALLRPAQDLGCGGRARRAARLRARAGPSAMGLSALAAAVCQGGGALALHGRLPACPGSWARSTALGSPGAVPSPLLYVRCASSSATPGPTASSAESAVPGVQEQQAGGGNGAPDQPGSGLGAVNGTSADMQGDGAAPAGDLGDTQIGWQLAQHDKEAAARGLLLSGGAFVLPHPEKMAKGGEDWYFIADNRRAIGVADGVGGWAEVGVDAGAYARGIMNNAAFVATAATSGESEAGGGGPAAAATDTQARGPDALLDAQAILERAYSMTNVMGSSTACVLVLNGATLTASNLGDSGFLVIRAGELLMATTQQQHSFNFPYQLGGAEAMGDHPGQAERYDVKVQPGDIIVMGTDGLWDNCFHEEILSVVKYCRDGDMTPERTSQVLAHYARHRASDTKFASPFSYSAYQAGIRYMGGKLDDITILVAVVEAAQPMQPTSKL